MEDKKYWRFLRAALRRASIKWPPRNEALKEARREYTGENKRQKWEYCCNKCNNWFKQTEIELDHITPCGELTKASHIKRFVLNLLCDKSGLQVLCKACHIRKTNDERS